MSGWKKLASAAAASGEVTNVEDVFSTYLYKGSGSTAQDIANNIDLSTEGGAVWIKARDQSYRHALYDTERGAGNFLVVNDSVAQQADGPSGLSAFNTDGFTLTNSHTETNSTAEKYVSWTFRRAPKFFDLIEWTGDANATKSLSHNLGVEPKFMMIREYSTANHQVTFEVTSSTTAYNEGGFSYNSGFTSTSYSSGNRLSSRPTATTLNVGGFANNSGSSYVAYLWANNDGDGEFGPTADQDIIKIGRYVSNGLTSGPEIDLGFEPQFVMVKSTVRSTDWLMWDTMRGLHAPNGGNDQQLQANQTYSESGGDLIRIQPTGFQIWSGDEKVNEGNSEEYWYMAIRRGPMAVPESATDVFAIDEASTGTRPPRFQSGFPVDFAFFREVGFASNWATSSRQTSTKELFLERTNFEGTSASYVFDFQNGWVNSTNAGTDSYSWMWQRAPNFFDVVNFTSTTSANRRIDHNLGVAPEMVWVKTRNATRNWYVYHKDMDANPRNYKMHLNLNSAKSQTIGIWGTSDPTATDFGLNENDVIGSGNVYTMAVMFATLDGVSKVGSYTGNGGTSVTGTGQNIDCGFSSGARFVLIKPTNADDHWFVYDSERGIVAGNDATLLLNSTTAQSTSSDEIDPYSSGFTILNGNNQLNRTGREYIFYAIA